MTTIPRESSIEQSSIGTPSCCPTRQVHASTATTCDASHHRRCSIYIRFEDMLGHDTWGTNERNETRTGNVCMSVTVFMNEWRRVRYWKPQTVAPGPEPYLFQKSHTVIIKDTPYCSAVPLLRTLIPCYIKENRTECILSLSDGLQTWLRKGKRGEVSEWDISTSIPHSNMEFARSGRGKK